MNFRVDNRWNEGPIKIEFKIVEISEDIGWNEGWETIKFKKVEFRKTMDEMKAEKKNMIPKVEPFKETYFFTIFQITTYDNC